MPGLGGSAREGRSMRRTRGRVVGKAEHDLGRAVPPRRDILGHEPLLVRLLPVLRRLVKPAREAKVANLEFAVGVHLRAAD